MSQDPIGYGDGVNMYAYAYNAPVNFRDPMGLCGSRISGHSAPGCTTTSFDQDSETGGGGSGGGGGGGGWEPAEPGEVFDHCAGGNDAICWNDRDLHFGFRGGAGLLGGGGSAGGGVSSPAGYGSNTEGVVEEIVVYAQRSGFSSAAERYGVFENQHLQTAGIYTVLFDEDAWDHIRDEHSLNAPKHKGRFFDQALATFDTTLLLLEWSVDTGTVTPNLKGAGYIHSFQHLSGFRVNLEVRLVV